MSKFLGVAVAALVLGVAAVPATAGSERGFNHRGHILIADQFNNRVVEINAHHQIVWSFGNGS
ncbi:MAG: hypothetical protein M3018_14760, partial [Actinomycetota bacterium]|nr:hypothetical protein [Actinomycetota bacterium]